MEVNGSKENQQQSRPPQTPLSRADLPKPSHATRGASISRAQSSSASAFGKSETRCIEMRKAKRQEIISKKKEAYQLQKAEREGMDRGPAQGEQITLRALLMNIRGLNSRPKQEALSQLVSSMQKPDIIALTETKL